MSWQNADIKMCLWIQAYTCTRQVWVHNFRPLWTWAVNIRPRGLGHPLDYMTA